MSQVGRKPKPTSLKKLSGNPGKRPLNKNEAHFPIPGRMLNPPNYLDEGARSVWTDLGKLLLNAGLFTVVDKYVFGTFCAAWSRWVKAELRRTDEGDVLTNSHGNRYANPWVSVSNQEWGKMQKMWSEFGLTPAERSRLKVAIQEDEPSLAETLFQMSES